MEKYEFIDSIFANDSEQEENPEWWRELSDEEKKKYLEEHPNSRFNEQSPSVENNISIEPPSNANPETDEPVFNSLSNEQQQEVTELLSEGSEVRTEAANQINVDENTREALNEMSDEEVEAANEVLISGNTYDFAISALSKMAELVVKAAGIAVIGITAVTLPGGMYLATNEILNPLLDKINSGAELVKDKVSRLEVGSVNESFFIFTTLIKDYIKNEPLDTNVLHRSIKMAK